ncbi:EAL domain-containing protein [Nitrosovibrio sp. Nv4]|uniref:EAL domain-containing protein n=1 Tax=Nitrosovibrio sp. Nv4 TaxID=1945880 RepID=UPI000BC93D60|nr:EAL domain-containing protein [Nitrosovibrio sp. Nv4]SOD41889.1 EAL domain, c-di-GMP-specific phosphodiesterase class I (or its enzymatically inactive variant) [Nitrosovibrio sp. Nv4]
MSLSRQLWLTVILVTLISFTGSLAISLISTQSYLEQQLHRKNIDSANSLAHSISQLSKDPITIGLQIAAVFDTGQYETISITSPDGRVIAERVQDRTDTTVPEWFIDLFPISAEAGRAQISDSWMHFGVIKVASRAQLAHQALWDQTASLLIWFLAAGLFCGLIGVLILYRIKKPLAAMVGQAEAITERRFLTISEPRIPELRSIARAANDMIRRLHNRAIEETSRLEALQKRLNYDPVTGLANREYFMNRLAEILRDGDTVPGMAVSESASAGGGEEAPSNKDAEIAASGGDEEVAARIEDGDTAPTDTEDKESEVAISSPGEGAAPGENGEAAVSGEIGEAVTSSGGDKDAALHEGTEAAPEDIVARKPPQSGILFLLRLNNLQEINQKLGRIETNNLLRQVGTLMGHVGAEAARGETSAPLAARLNGSDFALLVPDIEDARQIANELTKELAALSSQIGGQITDLCHIGVVRYQRGDQLGELFAKADAALSTAERAGINAWHAIAARPDHSPAPTINIGDWRQIFSDAFAEDRFKLALYPVAGRTGEPLHQEAFVRMQAQHDGGWLDASDFVNIAVRLNLTGPLDLAVIRHALESLKSSPGELAVNLSVETLADWDFRNKLVELLGQYPDFCPRLWVEVPEYGAFRKFEALRDFCDTLKALGCRTGIEHFGPQADKLQQLTGFGLDYLKVDAAFVHGIHQNKNNQRFLKDLCKLAHNIGIIVIALGVQTEAERKALIKLGFDGVAGPGIQ